MDAMGRAWLENKAAGSDSIEFSNWPTNYDNLKMAALKYRWRSLQLKYTKMIKLGEEVIKLLEKEG